MALNADQARADLAFRIAGVSTCAGAAPILRRRRVGDAYEAGDTHAGTVSDVGCAVTVRFQLPGGLGGDFIELGIPAVAGIYRIEALRVEGNEVTDLQRRILAAQDRLLETADTSAVRFGADACRPCLEIDVRELDARGAGDAGVVEVVIVREDSASELRTFLQHHAGTLVQLVRQQASEFAESALAHGDELRRQGMRLEDHGERLCALGDAQAVHAATLGELRQEQRVQGDAVLAQLTQLATALEAAGRVQQGAQQAQAAQSEALQAQVRHLQWSFDNVFWRRWLRRLRQSGRA